MGNARWTGVPVHAVIEALGGAVAGALFLTAAGAEPLPAGKDPPRAHRRAIGPAGYWGINHVKFLGRLACTAEESDARIQRSTYRVRPVGVRSSPSQPTMWEMYVKSLIVYPTDDDDVEAGPVEVRGYAWAGEAAVAGVEVSVDGGAGWAPAGLAADTDGPGAWREFRHTFTAAPDSEYRLVSRATDVNGETQPELPEPNERGYAHNGWGHPSLTPRSGEGLARAGARVVTNAAWRTSTRCPA